MASYLEKFKSTIGQNQFNKLMQVLNKQKKDGEFATLQQFKERMDALTNELFNKRITPLLKVYLQKARGAISSRTYNFMLDRIQNDLEIAFDEARNIDETLRGHQAIMKDMVLRNLKHALSDLESQVATHELIVSTGYGFNKVIYSNFAGASVSRLQRDDQNSSLFFDHRTSTALGLEFDSIIDEVGKYLTLPYEDTGYIKILDVRQIYDSTAVASEQEVTPDEMKLTNLIDNTNNTYWGKLYLYSTNDSFDSDDNPIVATDYIPSGVTTKLEFDFGGTKEINFVEIEPALLYEIKLNAIQYVKGDGSVASFSDIDEPIYNNRVKIPFRKIAAKKVILSFYNENSIHIDYSVNEKQTRLSDVVNSSLVEDLNLDNTLSQQNFHGKQFQIGFDNIKMGLANYNYEGIFISKPISIEAPAKTMGLKAIEKRPMSDTGLFDSVSLSEDTYDASDSNVYFGSLEYNVIYRMYDEYKNIISTDIFPILPIDVSKINHERLLLTHQYGTTLLNNTGKLRFYTTDSEGGIKVYRNGALLNNVAYESSEDGWTKETLLCSNIPNIGTPMRYAIRITQPRSGDIFTATYTPVVSNVKLIDLDGTEDSSSKHQRVIDLTGDLTVRSYTDQLIELLSIKRATNIVSADVYLMIVMRQDTGNKNLTPIVSEYMLGVGIEDKTKFEV